MRGEFRRLGAELLSELEAEALAEAGESTAGLGALLERAAEDLSGAAGDALKLLPDLAALAPSDTESRRRFEDAYERLEAVCRIILGR